jgi:hypothetical protein
MARPLRQANFLLPEELIAELRRVVPRGEQSRVVGDALRHELKRLRFRQTLGTAFGGWTRERHPELARGSRAFVRSLRRDRRVKRAAR